MHEYWLPANIYTPDRLIVGFVLGIIVGIVWLIRIKIVHDNQRLAEIEAIESREGSRSLPPSSDLDYVVLVPSIGPP